jgi:predicted DNA-binding protein
VMKMQKVKVSVNLTPEDIQTLEELAQQLGTSKTDILRRAIASEKFLREAQKSNKKILIEDNDKSLREIVFR